jgi:predicted anti-sigma-YlaC factor YlaD
MNELNCEKILMAKMAEIDGEKPEISGEKMDLHMAACENCRREFEQIENIGNLFKRQTRRESNPNLWAGIEKQIEEKHTSPISSKPFVFLGVFLIVYKLLEMLPERDFGLVFKIVPLIFIVALFVFLKENPFKINTELTLER